MARKSEDGNDALKNGYKAPPDTQAPDPLDTLFVNAAPEVQGQLEQAQPLTLHEVGDLCGRPLWLERSEGTAEWVFLRNVSLDADNEVSAADLVYPQRRPVVTRNFPTLMYGKTWRLWLTQPEGATSCSHPW